MKKALSLLIMFLFLFTVRVDALSNNINIKDIKIVDKSSTINVEDPTLEKNKINSSIVFNELDDFVIYELSIENNDTRDYKIDSIVDNNTGSYITTDYTYENDLLQNETESLIIKLTYSSPVLNTEKLSLNNLTVTMNLIDPDGNKLQASIITPHNSDNVFSFRFMILMSVIGLFLIISLLFNNRKRRKAKRLTIILAFLIVPFTIYASELIELNIKFSKIELIGKYEVEVNGERLYYNYDQSLGDIKIPEKNGYSFVKWVDGNDEEVNEETKITKPMVISPVYEVIKYKITYNLNGGSATNVKKYTIEDEITLNNPKKKGYVFAGWTKSNESTKENTVTISQGTTGNITFEAHYKKITASEVLKNKKVSILGDSISTLKEYIPSTNRARYVEDESKASKDLIYIKKNDTWWGGLIEDYNMTLGINESWAGSRVSNTTDVNKGDIGPDKAMSSVTRIKALADNGTPDVIFFFGGTNDIGKSVKLGSFDSSESYATTLDLTSTTQNSFVEAYSIALNRLRYYYPKSTIIALLPFSTKTYYKDSKLSKYKDQMKDICDYYGINYIDLGKSGIKSSNLSTYLVDGVHPNAKGMELIKKYIISKLNSNFS